MDSTFLNCYIFISILIALIDIVLAVKSFQKNQISGRFLGFACLCAAVVDISYLISILQDHYLIMSIMSSIYFVTIDLMLISLLIFTVHFTKGKFTKHGIIALSLISLYAIFEIVVFAINPFKEIAIS
ncbi:MAG: histidine kinase N-terminal 7TM domain-containing protein, partial [Anaerovoracaceae bacterium]